MCGPCSGEATPVLITVHESGYRQGMSPPLSPSKRRYEYQSLHPHYQSVEPFRRLEPGLIPDANCIASYAGSFPPELSVTGSGYSGQHPGARSAWTKSLPCPSSYRHDAPDPRKENPTGSVTQNIAPPTSGLSPQPISLLDHAGRKGRVREDLYHRLNVYLLQESPCVKGPPISPF